METNLRAEDVRAEALGCESSGRLAKSQCTRVISTSLVPTGTRCGEAALNFLPLLLHRRHEQSLARCQTTTGHPINVSLGLAAPPVVARMPPNFPDGIVAFYARDSSNELFLLLRPFMA